MFARRALLVRARAPLLMAFASGPQKLTLTLPARDHLWWFVKLAHRSLLLRACSPLYKDLASGPH